MELKNDKYCLITTSRHRICSKYNNILQEIDLLIERESQAKIKINSLELVFDMESVENQYENANQINKSNPRCDLAFFCANQKAVLVELKLNVSTNAYNIKPVNLCDKFSGSSKHFNSNELNDNCYTIVADSLSAQARSVFSRRRTSNCIPPHFEVCTLNDLRAKFFN